MIMLGIVEELKLNHILTTQVSRHCSTVIRETDLARRIIHAASENNITPKHINNGLLINHGHKDYAFTSDELSDMKSNIKDKNYRIYVNDDGVHLKNVHRVQRPTMIGTRVVEPLRTLVHRIRRVHCHG